MGKIVNLKEYKKQHKKPEKDNDPFLQEHPRMSMGILFAAAVAIVFCYGFFVSNPVDTSEAFSPISSSLPDGSISVEVKANQQNYFVFSGKINGSKVKFILDTRADAMVIPENVARFLRLKKGDQHYVNTASQELLGYRTSLKSLKIGAISLNQIPATISPELQGDFIVLGPIAIDPVGFDMGTGSMRLSISQRH